MRAMPSRRNCCGTMTRRDGFGQLARFARVRRGIEHRFEDRDRIARPGALAQQQRDGAVRGDDRQQVGADVLHDRRHGRAQVFEQRLEFLPAEQLGRVRAHDFREVRADDRDRIERQRAGRLRALALARARSTSP